VGIHASGLYFLLHPARDFDYNLPHMIFILIRNVALQDLHYKPYFTASERKTHKYEEWRERGCLPGLHVPDRGLPPKLPPKAQVRFEDGERHLPFQEAHRVAHPGYFPTSVTCVS
jgi:hypothetical protein